MVYTLDRRRLMVLGLLLAGCGDDAGASETGSTGDASTSTSTGAIDPSTADPPGTTEAADGTSGGTTSAGESTTTSGTTDAEDSSGGSSGGGELTCDDARDLFDPIVDCVFPPPPAQPFQPMVKWALPELDDDFRSNTTPLVANLTDDDGSGSIDLGDTPDIVLVANAVAMDPTPIGTLYVLDGETGVVHWSSTLEVASTVVPALGDLDGDGIPEIVVPTDNGHYTVLDHTGAELHTSGVQFDTNPGHGAINLADLDNDGDVEVLAGLRVFDHQGSLLHNFKPSFAGRVVVGADFDGDCDLEMVTATQVLHHDGSTLWDTGKIASIGGETQVADFDGDGLPEILVTDSIGVTLLEHDGTITYVDVEPVPSALGGAVWHNPAVVADFDGDGSPEWAMSYRGDDTLPFRVSAFDTAAVPQWAVDLPNLGGQVAAFDFLGDGTAELVHASADALRILDATGMELYSMPHATDNLGAQPVIADVDNDGAAEIVLVGSPSVVASGVPMIQVLEQDDAWVGARRIWNQHDYHVTNVREDGTIPRWELPHWPDFNSFRSNATTQGSDLCRP